ncbi:MAG: hypothetical protein K2P70_07295 [Hyphomonadaceae bacterium]|nr:hypothetical protein [Hyphomonadaceae bacterium]
MAFVTKLSEKSAPVSPKKHDEIEAEFFFFATEADDRLILQIDTYGRSSRDMPGKISQSFQLGVPQMRVLKNLLEKKLASLPPE